MLLYALIGLLLMLLGVAGLQFTYLFYLDRVFSERKKYLYSLEKRCSHLSAELDKARRRIGEQADLLRSMDVHVTREEEIWADIIDER